MTILKKIGIGLGVALIAIQFFRPAKNEGITDSNMAIGQVIFIPPSVQQILERVCYNCHSNHTDYPWYWNLQPAAWFLAHHIEEGKEQLNFSEFGKYSRRKQSHKLKGVANMIRDGDMPLPSYQLFHSAARLKDAEKNALTTWADSLSKELEK